MCADKSRVLDAEPYISLETLAAALNLPQRYLRDLAKEGMIPGLDVNGRLRFSLAAVQDALNGIAASEGGNDATD